MNDSIRHVRAADAPWMQRTTRLVQLPNSRGAPDPRRGGQRGGDQGFGAADALGEDAADPLLLLESLPPLETRNYVQKVMAGYWTYKTMFGEETPSLDAVAGGAAIIDARLDLANPTGPRTQFSGEWLRSGLN
jgi:hypothetical protein